MKATSRLDESAPVSEDRSAWRPPVIIQGGMGAAVSSWRLARAVANTGQLGVVSGVAINTVLLRRLQDGDPTGDLRRAIERFPDQAYGREVLERYFLPGGRESSRPYARCGVPSLWSSLDTQRLSVLGAFVEVWLAKEGHDGEVGLNVLEKLQLSNLPTIYGALLAGVDYVLAGAGVPRDVPLVLDRLAEHARAEARVALEQDAAGGAPVVVEFSPSECFPGFERIALRRPRFLGIVASASLAEYLLRHATSSIEGFVVEGPTAGGHNAPPRGALRLSASGEPIYAERDLPDAAGFRRLGLPFWLAGGWGTPEGLRRALELGASGVQAGTVFALCVESGLAPALREALDDKWLRGASDERVFTDPHASPTHFPFKVAPLAGTLSDPQVFAARRRVCDLGYLRALVREADGSLVYRCPAEPVEDFARKGGDPRLAEGRKCLCNALLANVGLGQARADGSIEPPLLTAGDGITRLRDWIDVTRGELRAADVVQRMLAASA